MEMSNTKLTTDEALEHLVNLIRRLFDEKIAQMMETPIKRRFEKDLFVALQALAEEPSSDIEALPIWVQRLVYEALTQYVMFFSLQPGIELSIGVDSIMTDNDKISAILRQEIIPNSWPYPQSVPF
jgi:hypothetical protein